MVLARSRSITRDGGEAKRDTAILISAPRRQNIGFSFATDRADPQSHCPERKHRHAVVVRPWYLSRRRPWIAVMRFARHPRTKAVTLGPWTCSRRRRHIVHDLQSVLGEKVQYTLAVVVDKKFEAYGPRTKLRPRANRNLPAAMGEGAGVWSSLLLSNRLETRIGRRHLRRVWLLGSPVVVRRPRTIRVHPD